MQLVGNAELILLQLLYAALFHHDNIAVALIAADKAVVILTPLSELVVDGLGEVVLYAVGLVLQQLVEIVRDDYARDGAGAFVLAADVVVLGHVHPVGYAHEGAVLIALLRADYVAVDAVALPADLKDAWVLGLALHEPFAAELRHHVGNAGVKARPGAAAHGKEHLVAPDYARVLEPEHRDWQREIHESVVFRRFGVVGHRLDVGRELLSLSSAHDERVDDEQQYHGSLGRRQLVHLEKQRCRRKQHHEEQVHAYIRLGKPLQIFVHLYPPRTAVPF